MKESIKKTRQRQRSCSNKVDKQLLTVNISLPNNGDSPNRCSSPSVTVLLPMKVGGVYSIE